MANLLALLGHAASSLNAHRAAVATAGHNIQNINTPGYSRQQANLAPVPADRIGNHYIGGGVQLQNITQIRDRFFEMQFPQATAAAARSQAESRALQSVYIFNPQLQNGVGDTLAKFYADIRTLSADAGNPGLRQQAVSSSRALALSFNNAATSLRQSRLGLDAQVENLTAKASALSQEIASLNRQIRIARASTSGGAPNDLMDQRTRARDELAQLTGANEILDGEGNVSMVLPNGASLVNGDFAARIETFPDPANGGHLGLRLIKFDGSTEAIAAMGGSIGGSLAARDGALRTALDQLDQLAFDFAQAVNAVHQAGFDLQGNPGGPLFHAGPVAAGAASRIVVEAAILANPDLLAASDTAAGAPGNGANFIALGAIEDQSLASGRNPMSTIAGIISDFGAASSRVTALAAHDTALLQNLDSMRESVSGVSLDEELIRVQQAQRAFDAVSKVISVTDELLDTLMRLK